VSLLNRASVSAIYPLTMLQLADERGIPRERILLNSGLNSAALHAPAARVTAQQQAVISHNLLQASADPAVGIELGLRANVTKIGLFGLGLMSCASFREVIALGIRYLPTKVPFFTLALSVERATAVVMASAVVPLGPLHQFAFDHFMAEVYGICGSLGDPEAFAAAHPRSELWLDSPQRDYYAAYRERLPRLRFGMPGNQFRFDAALLDTPIRTANAVTAQLIIEQCEQEMALLGYTESLGNRVRALLSCRDGHYPGLEQVADRLHMSSRTLKRRLAEERTSFSALLDEVRRRDALQLLLDPGRAIEEIALRVGYPDPANFRRAFRRWTGLSPTEYRERHPG